MRVNFGWKVIYLIILILPSACKREEPIPKVTAVAASPLAQTTPILGDGPCAMVESGFGPMGEVKLKTEKLVTGLEVPWAIGFLPDGDWLITERPGRVRRVHEGSLIPEPVLTIPVGEGGEGGLMGLAVDPRFSSNRYFYVYYTYPGSDSNSNRLEQYKLSDDSQSAQLNQVILEGVPAGTFHNGGRIHFGPDGMLYLGTGDAREPDSAQDPGSLAGKILRISPNGETVEKFILGVRNVQAFDWRDNETLLVADHGPSGERGLTGRDEVSIAQAGDNLGWPKITACETGSGWVTPFIAWKDALPPGGAIVYRGSAIPSFTGSFLIASLGAEHLHRIASNGAHEVYLSGGSGFGRLREIVTSPDGAVLITTSNCDSRGVCGADKDVILRVTEVGG